MRNIEYREICGDYALDLPIGEKEVFTLYFNSRQNALVVKRIIEVDGSVPNAATVADFVEVVRCKDCKYWGCDSRCDPRHNGLTLDYTMGIDYCSYGERKDGADNE